MNFWKMNGAGNDFIIINNIEEHIDKKEFPELAKTLCERHLSIGADGFMVVDKADGEADCKMIFYNSDGTMGEMCGNGARCICRYVYENGLGGEKQTIETTAGIVTGERIDERNYRIRLNDPSIIKENIVLTSRGKEYKLTYVELGNPGIPHAVVPYDNLENADENELRETGRELRHNPAFSKGANVNFIEVLSDGTVYIRTFERGVEDFTYACGTGTGSSAVALNLIHPDLTEFDCHMKGGKLKVELIENHESRKMIYLTGPTNIVAKGEVTDEEL